jgi:hypothetical protein
MRKYTFKVFRYSAAALLVVSAIGKLITTGSQAQILDLRDPLFLLPFRYLLWLVAGLELVVVFFCLNSKLRNTTQAAAVAWLSTNLLLYRIGLWLIDYQRPCSCMGTLAEGLHISSNSADTIMKAVLGYLLIGSFASLWFLRKHARDNASFDETDGALPGLYEKPVQVLK